MEAQESRRTGNRTLNTERGYHGDTVIRYDLPFLKLRSIYVRRLRCRLLVRIRNVSGTGANTARVFELRTYHTPDGKLDNLLARFRDHTIDLFNKHGMTSIGYWVPTGRACSRAKH